MPYQKVKYELYSEELGLLELEHDPINWQEDNKTLERSAKSESFFTRFSNTISFIREGATYITTFLSGFGTKGNIYCRRFEKNPITNEFVKVYDENLDLESYEFENNVVSIGFLSGGLNDVIKSQFKEKFELQRTESIENEDIGNLEYESLGITGRKIFLKSLMKNEEDVNDVYENLYYSFDQIIQYQSDENVNSILNFDDNFIGFGGASSVFFDDNQVVYKNESNRVRAINVTLKAKGSYTNSVSGNARFMEFVALSGLSFNEPNSQWDGSILDKQVFERFDSSNSAQTFDFDVDQTLSVSVEPGEAFSVFISQTIFPGSNASLSINKEDISILFEEDSTYFPTKAKGLLFKDALKRVLKIMTGRDDVLKSDFFNTGQWEELFITSGIFLREFPINEVDENGEPVADSDGTVKTNGIITSLDELLSIKAHLNIGWGVEKINDIEFFRVEPLEYFFQNKVAVRIPGKYCPRRSIANEFIYSSVSIGNAKSGSYEEQQGLYEYNALNSWTTSNIKSDNKYTLNTSLRTDPIGAEYTRRNAYSLSPTLDTPEDKENWIFHVKKVSEGNYDLRFWQDDFTIKPKQVYDPDSAYNLLLSPLRSLERHGWYLNSSLFVYPDENILFADSTGNANMITQIDGEVERGENLPYRNGDFRRPRFIYEYLDFDFPNSFDIKLQINSFFKDNNSNLIPNFYGMVEFTNENDELEYGWILKVIENDTGSFRLIKANR